MRNFENNVKYIKYQINREVARWFFQKKLRKEEETLWGIAETIIPGPKPFFRCCIYKERHIVEERVRLLLAKEKDEKIIHVLDSACDECPIDRFAVSGVCRGCLGHRCVEVCPRNAISVVNHKAHIDQTLCIECGRCKQVCPFDAISEVKRPCIRACAVGAVKIDENRKAAIDYDKCIFCGTCVSQCPFGAIVDKGYLIDVLQLLKDSQNHTVYHVYAIVDPTGVDQVFNGSVGQIFGAIKELGFYDVVDDMLGQVLATWTQLKEFADSIEQLEWSISSRCPALTAYVKKNYEDYIGHVSQVALPMEMLAKKIRKKDEKAKIVFIGSCIANKSVVSNRKSNDCTVDYVITFEELQAIFDAKRIVVEDCPELNVDEDTVMFIKSMRNTAKELEIQNELTPVFCDGIEACMKTMKLAKFHRLEGNLIEGKGCTGSCRNGVLSLVKVFGCNDAGKYRNIEASKVSFE